MLETVLNYGRKDRTVTDRRPADLLEPELEKARESIKDLSDDMGDILTAALYPDTGLSFLKKKYGQKDS